MTRAKLIVLAGIFLSSHAAFAADINYNAMSNGGFNDVAQLLQEMTPQQRQAVLEQAAIKEQDLEKMTPAELESLRLQLRNIGDTIYMDKIDPAKLDVAKSKPTPAIQKDLGNYQTKYKQNQIRNSAVKPNTSAQ